MENTKILNEPLKINNSGIYELYDYSNASDIALSSALLLSSNIENDLMTTIKIMNKKSKKEVDRLTLMAFQNPTLPMKDRITITGKFFNPKNHYLKIEPKSSTIDILFLLYFSALEK